MVLSLKMSIPRAASDNIFCAKGQSNFIVSAGLRRPALLQVAFAGPPNGFVALVLLRNELRLFKCTHDWRPSQSGEQPAPGRFPSPTPRIVTIDRHPDIEERTY
jgi:hypothetical protein